MERKRNEYFIIAYDIFDFSEQSVDWTRDRVTRGFGEFEDWNRVRHNSVTSFTRVLSKYFKNFIYHSFQTSGLTNSLLFSE